MPGKNPEGVSGSFAPEPNPKDYSDPIIFSQDWNDWRKMEEQHNHPASQVCGGDCPCKSEQGIRAFSCDAVTQKTLCLCGEALARIARAKAFHEAGQIVSAALGFSERYNQPVSLPSLVNALHVKGLEAENAGR